MTTRDGIKGDLDNINYQIRYAETKVTQTRITCESITRQITDNQNQIIDFEGQLRTIDSRISNLVNVVNQKQTIVDDLQAKLNAAIRDRDTSKKDLDDARSARDTYPSRITTLK